MSPHNDLANAIESGSVERVRQVLAEHPSLVNSPDWTPPPLHCAVLWNQPRVAEVLLDHGADIELRDPDRQTTPLRYAIVFAKTEMIPLLLARGANSGQVNGSTAMQLAMEAANGGFEEFDDLPSSEEYRQVIAVLKESGVQ